MRDGKPWTHADEMAAVGIEQAGIWSRILAGFFAKHPDRLPPAVAINHPHRPRPERPKANPDQIRAFFARASGMR